MPPRIPGKLVANSLPCLHPPSASSASLLSASPSPSPSSRPLSSTAASQTRLREQMFEWLGGQGQDLKVHTPGVPNYITTLRERRERGPAAEQSGNQGAAQDSGAGREPRPFPLNPAFVSESVLSEELRGEIFQRVAVQKQNIREVSVDLGVDMRRIGAVVRLVELERRWRKQNKPLALPYARAVHEMVPVTPLEKRPNIPQPPHESINDLPAHRLTEPQIFYPVSESRRFTRADAGRVFSGAPAAKPEDEQRRAADPTATMLAITERPSSVERVGKGDQETQVLQPADVRIPHPHLIAYHRDRFTMPHEKDQWAKRYQERLQRDEAARNQRKKYAAARQDERTIRVQPEKSRFEFRFSDVAVDKGTTGPDGRGIKAPGRRYGVPNYDRSKGQVKIPTRVDV